MALVLAHDDVSTVPAGGHWRADAARGLRRDGAGGRRPRDHHRRPHGREGRATSSTARVASTCRRRSSRTSTARPTSRPRKSCSPTSRFSERSHERSRRLRPVRDDHHGARRATGVGDTPELERLYDVPVELAVEIGRTHMTIRETLALGPGSIVSLNRLAGEPVDLLVNGKPIARGEVVVIDEEFGLRVTEVVVGDPAGASGSPSARRAARRGARRAGSGRGSRSRAAGVANRRGADNPARMGRARAAVVCFWRKAYEDNLTGLASMVAYNLLLSIFPVALVALFVAGRVLRSSELQDSVRARPPAAVPEAAESHAERRRPAAAGVLDHRRDRRARRRGLVRLLVLGLARHRVLPDLPPRLPDLGAPEAVRDRHVRASCCCSSSPPSRCRRCRACW